MAVVFTFAQKVDLLLSKATLQTDTNNLPELLISGYALITELQVMEVHVCVVNSPH